MWVGHVKMVMLVKRASVLAALAAVLVQLEHVGSTAQAAQQQLHATTSCGSDPQQVQCSNGELASFGDQSLAVQPSSIEGAGLGAFARRPFARGDALGAYRCVIGEASVESEDSNAPYGWTLNATHICDGEPIRLHNPLRYVNSVAAEETCGRQNVAMRLAPPGRHRAVESPIEYVATRHIREGDELLVDYGERYFKVRSQRSKAVSAGCLDAARVT